jgi:phosphoribosylformimino-5-aminoimidazole carboxamide ribotide isomerase
MQGPNFEETAKLAEAITTPVIASGGISSVEDIRRYKDYANIGIEGCILGRALYEGAIKAEEALKI